MPYSDHSYLDPLHIVWREGTENDPYIDRVEFLKIVNQKIVLSEIPDKQTRVKISGFIEINYESDDKKRLGEKEYSVNYSTGVIQFHPSNEGKSVNCSYKGRGFIQYPSTRIYHQDEMNDVVESLDKIIERAKKSVDDAERKVQDYELIRDRVIDQMTQAQVATTNAKQATHDANVATEKALDAYETTRLVFMPYVNSYEDIEATYPDPDIGWTVQVYDTGIRYRWDGIQWVPIDLFGGNIPLADESIDGLMSKDDFIKLKNLDRETYSKRAIVFVMPSYLTLGVQPIIARFPFKGRVIGVKGLCGVAGETNTQIQIQKSRDMIDWNTIMSTNLFIRANNHFDDGTANVFNEEVYEGDLFRINVLEQGVNIQNVTVEVIVETTNILNGEE